MTADVPDEKALVPQPEDRRDPTDPEGATQNGAAPFYFCPLHGVPLTPTPLGSQTCRECEAHWSVYDKGHYFRMERLMGLPPELLERRTRVFQEQMPPPFHRVPPAGGPDIPAATPDWEALLDAVAHACVQSIEEMTREDDLADYLPNERLLPKRSRNLSPSEAKELESRRDILGSEVFWTRLRLKILAHAADKGAGEGTEESDERPAGTVGDATGPRGRGRPVEGSGDAPRPGAGGGDDERRGRTLPGGHVPPEAAAPPVASEAFQDRADDDDDEDDWGTA